MQIYNVYEQQVKEKFWKKLSLVIYLVSLVILMVGFAYVSVPLYQLYCQALGGTGNPWSIFGLYERHQVSTNTDMSKSMENEQGLDSSVPIEDSKKKFQREPLTIYFNADTSENLPWDFKPCLQKLKVYPGDTALSFYIASNKTKESISGISTYSITPSKVGIYFNKIQCFCFEEQRLKPNEQVEMPILFFIDPEFEKDPKMKDVHSINLSYTFYRVDD